MYVGNIYLLAEGCQRVVRASDLWLTVTCMIYSLPPSWAVRVIRSAAMHCVPANSIDATYRFITLHATEGKNVDTLPRFLKNERLIKIALRFCGLIETDSRYTFVILQGLWTPTGLTKFKLFNEVVDPKYM
jgi:hypothetical protein